jgi:hypothetical protein
MTRQSLRQHAAFVALDGIREKIDIDEITDLLIQVGYIEDSPDDYRRFQIEQARRTIREHRKSKLKRGEIQHELVSLYEVQEDGTKVYYWRPCGRLSAKEAAQHIRYWDNKLSEDQEQRNRYFDFHLDRHGKKFERYLLAGMETD